VLQVAKQTFDSANIRVNFPRDGRNTAKAWAFESVHAENVGVT
jgi:hypothetical protein